MFLLLFSSYFVSAVLADLDMSPIDCNRKDGNYNGRIVNLARPFANSNQLGFIGMTHAGATSWTVDFYGNGTDNDPNRNIVLRARFIFQAGGKRTLITSFIDGKWGAETNRQNPWILNRNFYLILQYSNSTYRFTISNAIDLVQVPITRPDIPIVSYKVYGDNTIKNLVMSCKRPTTIAPTTPAATVAPAATAAPAATEAPVKAAPAAPAVTEAPVKAAPAATAAPTTQKPSSGVHSDPGEAQEAQQGQEAQDDEEDCDDSESADAASESSKKGSISGRKSSSKKQLDETESEEEELRKSSHKRRRVVESADEDEEYVKRSRRKQRVVDSSESEEYGRRSGSGRGRGVSESDSDDEEDQRNSNSRRMNDRYPTRPRFDTGDESGASSDEDDCDCLTGLN